MKRCSEPLIYTEGKFWEVYYCPALCLVVYTSVGERRFDQRLCFTCIYKPLAR